jgi:phosphoribosyl-ATP pyrophosphohydrolase
MPTDTVLEDLYRVILSRRGADPAQSNTARLFAKGKKKIAQKLGEEAVETLIEGVKGDKDGVISESADLLYHLLVLWAALDVQPHEVWAKLRAREGISGIAEKASRPKD